MNEPLLILCGGRSTRMGRPKPLLLFKGQTLIARQVGNALPHRPVWLAAAEMRYPDTDGAVYLPDYLPQQQGALSAILPALLLAQEQGFHGIYILSCDTLLLPEAMIAQLNTASQKHIWQQGITAFHDGHHALPLLAHWSVQCVDSLRHAVQSGQKRVQIWCEQQAHQYIALPEQWATWCHFNTPEAFAHALQTIPHESENL